MDNLYYEIKEEFEHLKRSNLYNQDEKNYLYATLMTKLEKNFDIPLLEMDIIEETKELKLYQEISLERNFEDVQNTILL